MNGLRFQSLAAPRADAGGRGVDAVLFTSLVLLLVLGLLAVYTSSAGVSLDRYGSPHAIVLRHLVHLALGAGVLAVLWRVDYRQLDRPALVHGLWIVLVLLLTLTLFEAPAGGARRWLRLGGVSLQPSELAKLVVVLATALHFSRAGQGREQGPSGSERVAGQRPDPPRAGFANPPAASRTMRWPWSGLLSGPGSSRGRMLLPLVLTAQLAGLVALQPDFGTAAALIGIFALVAFVGGAPLRRLAAFGGVAVGALALYLVQEPYRVLRLKTFLDPLSDPLGAGFQLRQSLIAIGSGGLAGRSGEGLLGSGFGCSVQKLFFLPEPHTDFVFAVLGEELGLIGTVSVCVLFAVVLVRGLRAAARAATPFGSLLATGATAMISFQAFVNMMVVVGLLPTKGIPLPFLSSGGSSLVASCAAGGILLAVSRDAG